MRKSTSLISPVVHEAITRKIYLIRNRKVMLDRDLAELYGVSTRVLNQAVKRNADRFPEDFMIQLTKQETENWKSQFVTSKQNPLRSQFVTLKRGQHIKYLPYAFTEPGVAMLSSVLKSKTAIRVNIQIVRTFIKLRELLATNELIRHKIEELERKHEKHDQQLKNIFDTIRAILEMPKTSKRKPIGFHVKY